MDQPAQPSQPAPPEQSVPPPQPLQTQALGAPVAFSAQTNTLAIVSLISGIVSWFAVPVIGGVVAVITGHMAKGEIRRTGEQGDTLATVGLVLGYLHLAVVLLVVVILLVIFAGTFAIIRSATSG
jgi:zinc transporter ZupT